MIAIDGASHVTINGLQLQHFRWAGIGLHGGGHFYELFPASSAMADSNTVTNNMIHDGSYDTSPIFGYGGGAFYSEGNIPNTTVTNNVVYNISAFGIQVAAGIAGSGGNLSSLRIANNVVLSTCLLVTDCGSIYVQDTNTTSTNIRITNNFVRDSGTPTSKARSIYLDDGVSGAVVSNNISAGVFNFAFTIHGGSNNTISSNIVDLGPHNNQKILLYQGDGLTGMTSNTVQNNLFVSGGSGGWYEGNSFGAQPTIKNNVYHRVRGGTYLHPRPQWPEWRCLSCLRRSAAVLLDIRSGQRQPGPWCTGVVHFAPARLGPPRLHRAGDRHASFTAVLLLTTAPYLGGVALLIALARSSYDARRTQRRRLARATPTCSWRCELTAVCQMQRRSLFTLRTYSWRAHTSLGVLRIQTIAGSYTCRSTR